jgi:hypothetical protein
LWICYTFCDFPIPKLFVSRLSDAVVFLDFLHELFDRLPNDFDSLLDKWSLTDHLIGRDGYDVGLPARFAFWGLARTRGQTAQQSLFVFW